MGPETKGNPEMVQKSISNITSYAYGEHDNCGSWCDLKDPHTKRRKHQSLPYGRDMQSIELRQALDEIFKRFC